jgi:hypothetical protein
MTVPDLPATGTQDWFFTFGAGQRLFSGHRAGRGIDPAAIGIPLDNYYVVIHGYFLEARARMCEMFGGIWCDQYDALEKFASFYPVPPLRLPIPEGEIKP